jgi:hypothetical protein
MLLSLVGHALIWLGNTFTLGHYPWLASQVISPQQQIYPLALLILVTFLLLVVSYLRFLAVTLPEKDPLGQTIRTPRWWHKNLLTLPTTPRGAVGHYNGVIYEILLACRNKKSLAQPGARGADRKQFIPARLRA